MAHAGIGFSNGIPQNLDKTWKSTIGDATYIFTKKRHNETIFLYSCERSIPSGEKGPYTGFYSDRDLQPDEIEKLRQFDNVIGRT
jgi:hypothetical protein